MQTETKVNQHRDEDTLLYVLRIGASNQGYAHVLRRYTFLRIIGDIGGVLQLMLFMVGLLVYPFTQFSFLLTAMRQMYLAKTKNAKIMTKIELGDGKKGRFAPYKRVNAPRDLQGLADKFYPIVLSPWRQFLMLL